MDRNEELRLRLAGASADDRVLQLLRDAFRDEVRSVRRVEKLKTVRDLIGILEKQDLLDHDRLIRIKSIVDVAPQRMESNAGKYLLCSLG